MADDDVNKECHIEGHQKVCVLLPPGPKYWPKVLDSKSKVHLIISHNTKKKLFTLKSMLSPLFPVTLAFVPLI